MKNIKQLPKGRAGSAIPLAAELAGLFETEAEWESAEQTRVLLYHFLRGNFSAAGKIFETLSRHRVERLPASGARSEIAQRLATLAPILGHSATQQTGDHDDARKRPAARDNRGGLPRD